MRRQLSICTLLVLTLVIAIAATVSAMPPTEEAIQQWIADGVWQQKIQNWQEFRQNGGNAPWEYSPLAGRRSIDAALDANAVDTLNVIVIMVEFTDWLASGQNYSATPSDFDSLLFSDRETQPGFNPTGSMTDFYMESSYGTLFIKGDIFGWYMMPETYVHYVGTNDGLGGGGAELAGHAVDAAEAAGVNFQPYANGDIYVDGVIVVHAGAGAETGVYGIWSHRSSMTLRIYDGVRIQPYTMNPEEYGTGISTMGVYGHEWGHVLGLPDLYDLNDASPGAGLGLWSMMAGGSWNNNGRTPAQFDPWCRERLGFVNITWLSDNLENVEIPQILHNPVVYGLGKNPGPGSTEYWLVENRQRIGFDAALPGAGLCIYHVDESVFSQSNPDHYKVALEQADGDNDLSINGGSDSGDPWPGQTNNRNFHDRSLPDSRDYWGITTEVGVWNVSNSDSLMYADLDVTFSRAWIEMTSADSTRFADSTGGDADGVLEAGETIDFYVKVVNRMRVGYSPVASLSSDIEGITFIQNDVPLNTDLTFNTTATNVIPIRFTLAADFESVIGDLTITIVADSASGSGDGLWQATFSIEQVLGATQILVVDDDDGATWETKYETTIDHLRKPADFWTKTSGSPTGTDLLDYNSVIWYMGSNLGPGGTLTTDDVAAMKEFMDGGGNLFLTSMTAAAQLQTLDSAFMADYLHVTLAGGNVFGLAAVGIDGKEIGDGIRMTYDGNAPINPMHDLLAPVGSAEAEFYLADDFGYGNFGTCGVSYSGDYRSFFLTLPFEFVNDDQLQVGWAPKDTVLKHILDFFSYSYPYVRWIDAESDDFSAMTNHTPTFVWNVKDTGLAVQTEYELEVGTDTDWGTAEMWSTGVVSSADTTAVYSGASLLDGTTYFIRIRAGNGTYWSEWYQTSFHMNSTPLAPSPLSPDGNPLTDVNPTLMVQNGSDVESSSLAYQFEIATDGAFSTIVATSPNVAQTADSTGWFVAIALADFTQHWWRARTYDGAEYSDWSIAATFTVNSAYEVPTGSLKLYSATVYPLDTSCVVQPVDIVASKPLTKAIIPLKIPAGVTICDITFDGYVTASWDLNNVVINESSGFVVVTLDNSTGDTLSTGGGTVFDVQFMIDRPCQSSEFVVWDTARYDFPTDQLQYTDTMESFSPDFLFGQDSTEIAGYVPGNIDNTLPVDIGDLTVLISYLFIQGPKPVIINSGDVNADCVGPDIGDLTNLIGYLFIQGDDPLCGCLGGGAPAPRQSGGVEVQARFEDGKTVISLTSPIDLRGVQLDLNSSDLVNAEILTDAPLDLMTGEFGGNARLALLDLDGMAVLPAGRHDLIRVEGEYEIGAALVSDMNHAVWAASVGAGSGSNLPTSYALEQNYPNPFNPVTQIRFAIPEAANVTLDVFNVLGRKVMTIIDGRMDAGYHAVDWDGHNENGEQVASGVYLYRLSADDYVQSRKMLLLK